MDEDKRQPDTGENQQELEVVHRIIQHLLPLSTTARRRMIDTVCTFLGITGIRRDVEREISVTSHPRESPVTSFQFSESPHPKDFMHEKAPDTDIERVACLAYFLTHFRATPHFKTRDISDLNTEAAQRRFSNPAFAVANATTAGYLVPSVKGSKQLSASGERFVEALPDRDAARNVLEKLKPRRGAKRLRKKPDRNSKS